MASIAHEAYKYNKFNCSSCQCGSHVCYSSTLDTIFFMCIECTSCLVMPNVTDGVIGDITSDQIFDMDADSLGEFGSATLEQIVSIGLDLKCVYKRHPDGSTTYLS